MDWTSNGSEMKQGEIELVTRTIDSPDNNTTFLVAMRLGETPVYIPNTMVKT